VKVDGHSSSPIFVEDQRRLAFDLFEAHAIDRAELIELVSPPKKQILLGKLKAMEAAEKKQHEEAAKMEAAKAGGKGGGAAPAGPGPK